MGACQSQFENLKIFPGDANGNLSSLLKVKNGHKILVSGLARVGKTSLILSVIQQVIPSKKTDEQQAPVHHATDGRLPAVITPPSSKQLQLHKPLYKGMNLIVYDLPGGHEYRESWMHDHILTDIKTIVHLVDATNEEQIALSLFELERLYAACHERTNGKISVLLLVSKQDDRHAVPFQVVTERIQESQHRIVEYGVSMTIMGCSSRKHKDLEQVLSWIMSNINR